LRRFIEETVSAGLPIDIRCTDTDSTPNSVLLVGSRGDLFTEGYAHDGKVLLYKADQGRPDLVRASWFHLDRFGHARRYLNWNPWMAEGRSLELLCYVPPMANRGTEEVDDLIESEAKFKIADVEAFRL